jgi:hypothetical protein
VRVATLLGWDAGRFDCTVRVRSEPRDGPRVIDVQRRGLTIPAYLRLSAAPASRPARPFTPAVGHH